MVPRNPRPAAYRTIYTGALVFVMAAGAVADARQPAQTGKFADPAFERVWQRTDLPVAKGLVARTWFWGPQPGEARREFFQGSGAGHLVQYFDKARMEINDPSANPNSPWYVTNGLLTVELIMGELLGDPTAHAPLGPADIPLASDLDDANAPTYRSFRAVADVPGSGSHAVGPATGQPALATIKKAGQVGKDPSKAALGDAVKYAHYEPATRHNVVGAFWTFLNSTGPVYENGQTRPRLLSDPWFYATGYPISEAYWARVRIAGQPHDVLIQAFQRRVLTYVPDNPAAWRVQMGNIGQHYYRWRYGSAQPAPTTVPAARPSGRIVFVSNRSGASPGIFTMAPGGSDVRQVARTPGGNLAPRFAAAGKAIAYYNLPPGSSVPPDLDSAEMPAKARIMLTSDDVGADGVPLGATSVASWDGQADPAFSPNGTLLAFRGKPAGEQAGIFVANLASDAPMIPVQRLTTGAWDRQPVWSPDGKTIAFTSGGSEADSQIWTMSADGSGKRALTPAFSRRWDADPAWSPDGRKIVYASTGPRGTYDIVQVTLDGAQGPPITGGEGGNQRHPSFSPDGAWLAFSSDKDGNLEVVVAPADGSRWTNISHSPSVDGQPNWGK